MPTNDTMRAARLPVSYAILATLLLAAPAFAQTGTELLLQPFPKEQRLNADADVTLMDTGHSKETDQSIRLGIYETEGRLRLNPGDVASTRLGYSFKYFDIASDVPALPKHATDVSVGFATPIGKYEDWIFGVSLAVGYAGAEPFGDGNGWYGKAGLVAFKQIDETTALAIALDYNGNRTFKPDLPLPGFAFIKRIRSDLLLTVGLPVTSIEWKPVEHLRVELSYLLTDNFGARIGYEFVKGLEVYGSVGQRTDAFFLDQQWHSNDRLLYQQRQAEIGLTYRTRDAGVGDKDVELTIAAGYAFSREFSVGFDTNDSRLIADVSDEPYIRFAVQVRF
jgi:hypothetical protein